MRRSAAARLLKAKRPRGACAARGEIIAPPHFCGAPRRSRSHRPSPGMVLRLRLRRRGRARRGGYREVRGARGGPAPRAAPFRAREAAQALQLSNSEGRESHNETIQPGNCDELQWLVRNPVGFVQCCEPAAAKGLRTKSSTERSLLRPTRRLGGGGRCFAMHTSLKGGARNSSRRLSFCNRASMPPAAAARAGRTTPRRSRPARQFARAQNGQATKVACPVNQAASGGSFSAPPSLVSATSPSALAASPCRTLAAAFALPTPPRVV